MLLDHFHPPVSELRGWEGFHHSWAVAVADHLNRQLAPPWHAEPHLRFGLEIDVAGLHREVAEPLAGFPPPMQYEPDPPQLTVPLPELTDSLEVEILRVEGGREVVAAIEFVSPANKDRPDRRQAFVAKCESLLSRGIGVVVVDVVTERRANLHVELMQRLGGSSHEVGGLYAASYHPIERDAQASLDVWFEPLSVGEVLPDLPLFLRDGPCLKVALQQTYNRVCRQSRLDRDLNFLESTRRPSQA